MTLRKLLALGFAFFAALTAAPVLGQEELEQQAPPASPVAKQVYLLMRFGQVSGASLHSLPMADMDQCEMAGAEFTASKRLYPDGDYRGYECLEGSR